MSRAGDGKGGGEILKKHALTSKISVYLSTLSTCEIPVNITYIKISVLLKKIDFCLR
jgi:hypothetical protein